MIVASCEEAGDLLQCVIT